MRITYFTNQIFHETGKKKLIFVLFQDRKKYELSAEYRRRIEEWNKSRFDCNTPPAESNSEEDTPLTYLVLGWDSLPDEFHSDENASATISVSNWDDSCEEYDSDDTTATVSDSENPIDGSDSEDVNSTTTLVTDYENIGGKSESEDHSLMAPSHNQFGSLERKYGIAEPDNDFVTILK